MMAVNFSFIIHEDDSSTFNSERELCCCELSLEDHSSISSSSSSVASCHHESVDQEDPRNQSKESAEPALRVFEEQIGVLSRKIPVVKRSRRSAVIRKKESATSDILPSADSPLDSGVYSSSDQFDNDSHSYSDRRSSFDPDLIQRRISFCRQRRRSTPHLSSSIAEDCELDTTNTNSPIFSDRSGVEKQRGTSISIPHERKKSGDSSIFFGAAFRNPLKSKRNFSVDDLWQGSDIGQEIKRSFSQIQKSSILIPYKSNYRELVKRGGNSSNEGSDYPSSGPDSPGGERKSPEVERAKVETTHRRRKSSSRHKKLSLPVLWKFSDPEMMTPHRREIRPLQRLTDQSLNSIEGVNTPKSFDAVVFDVLRVSSEEYARQLTLLDWPLFAAITPDEISGCEWVSKDKWDLAPKICAMTRRFNHTSFWVIHEILHASSTKARADTITLFIKVAKRLHELNNIHSLMAVIQSLNSSSIIRLSKTWLLVAKSHRITFDRLLHLVREDGNRAELRSYMEGVRLPCIPFLGMYLSDAMYINSAHPDNGGLVNHERSNKMNNILRLLSEFQQSKYDHLQDQPHIQNYLTNINYIEELQKFLEEDNYKRSLKIEPPQQSNSLHRNNHIKLDARLSVDAVLRHHSDALSSPDKFVPGHRKTRSLGREGTFGVVSLRNKSDPAKTPKRQSWYSRGRHRESTVWYLSPTKGFPSEGTPLSGSLNRGAEQLPTIAITTSLLDDSIIDLTPTPSSSSSSCARIAVASSNNGSVGSSRSNSDPECGELDETWDRSIDTPPHEFQTCSFEGCLKRKCTLKRGKKPSMSSWSRYWVCICDSKLVYFAPKHLKATERHHFKSRPCKVISILHWMLLYSEDSSRLDSFQLNNPDTGDMYKFLCDSKDVARVWIARLEEATKGHPQPERNLINLDDN